MRSVLCGFLLLFALPWAQGSSWESQNEEEALFIRRIADFWQEGEYRIVKEEIEEFLVHFPESSCAQSLRATLGDLYLREKNHKGALLQYARIDDPKLTDRVFINRMECLFELQWFATLADECEAFLQKEKIEPEQRDRVVYLFTIALYQQSLNISKDSEAFIQLAKRAAPYFEKVLSCEYPDAAQACAYLSCALKNYSFAAGVFLQLAEKGGTSTEEMLFQAALCQAEFDKKLAIQTFDQIAIMGQSRAQEAIYNRLILSYDTAQYEELLDKKEELLASIPPDKQNAAHLFFGRSYLELKKYPDALRELFIFVDAAISPSDALHLALIDILETAYHLDDEASVKKATDYLTKFFPDDKEISKGKLAHALILKNQNRLEEARQELDVLTTRDNCLEKEPALYERLHLEFQSNHWELSRHLADQYLKEFSGSELTPYVWRYFAAASSHLATESSDPALKEQLVRDLETLFDHSPLFSDQEKNEWAFLYAKTNYDLKRWKMAIQTLEKVTENQEFSERANAFLLLALCYRDGTKNIEKFCSLAEEAIHGHATLLEEGTLRLSLYNAYLSFKNESSLEKAAEHLLAASFLTPISMENLQWLAEFFYEKSEKENHANATLAQHACDAIEQYIASAKVDITVLDETTLFVEPFLAKKAELIGALHQNEKELQVLQNLTSQYEKHPSWAWTEESKVDLLFGLYYSKSNHPDQALEWFDRVVAKNPTVRSYISASAALQAIRIRLHRWEQLLPNPDHPELIRVLTQLKSLIIQKTLANEPIHLEAALEYVDLQTRLEKKENQMEKRLALLAKTKADFEKTDDILSRDYHKSRKFLPEKSHLLEAYLRYFEAEMVNCQAELSHTANDRARLKESAQKMYQEILKGSMTAFLIGKASEQLQRMDQK